MIVLYIIGSIVGLILILRFGSALYFHLRYPAQRKKEPGFKYVHVDNDGSVRELYSEEVEYLTAKYHSADGNRPYIKNSYEQKTLDGKISGYILRTRVPTNLTIITKDRGY